MAILVKCPKCKCDIENDSLFCDQCGTELFICPQCKTFGKGKRCTQCGTELVSAAAFAGGAVPAPAPAPAPAQPSTPQPAQPAQPAPSQPVQPSQPVAPQPTQIPQPVAPQPSQMPQPTSVPPQMPVPPASSAEKTIRPGAPQQPQFTQPQQQPGHIVCYYPQHIRLGLASGVIIGRRGHYPSVFAAFGDVSGNHARLDRMGADWTVTDLGSTNGTFINGQPLQPNVPYPMHVGDTIRFSTLDFKVEV